LPKTATVLTTSAIFQPARTLRVHHCGTLAAANACTQHPQKGIISGAVGWLRSLPFMAFP
jgi:hypothetical protein